MSEDGPRTGRIQNKTLYKVESNTDTTEGRGRQYTIGWFVDASVAESAARGQYVMGTDCPVKQEIITVFIEDESRRIFILGKEVEISYEDPKVVRDRALKKLSAAEKAALGL